MKIVRVARPSSSRCLVGGVFGAAAREAAQDLLGLGGAELQRGGVLDELVVLLSDEVPVDRPPGDHRRELGPVGVGRQAGPVQAGGADAFEAW